MLFEEIAQFLLGRKTWPPPNQRLLWDASEFWAALRRSDEVRIKMQASVPWHRRYLLSPVPRMVSRASANLLFGEEPEIRPDDETDADNMTRLVEENDLASELHRAALIASSEGEVWGRIMVDTSLADVPIVEFVSRRQVIPMFSGRFVTGATFLNEWPEGSNTVMRLLETYEPGLVTAQLYRGTRTSLGTEAPLDSYAKTAGREPQVPTGFDYPLCAFVPNSIDADPSRGFSDYAGLEERFLALNEASTIAQENLKLAGKKRALLDAKYLRNGRLPAGDDIFIRADDETTAGESASPLQMIDYSFDAQQISSYLDQLIDTTLTMAGVAPQLVGRQVNDRGLSGTALKLKMIHSLMEATGKGRYMDRGIKRLLRAAAIIDGRRTTEGGFGRKWADPDTDPSIARGDGLPRDDQEAVAWVVQAHAADAISLEERVRYLHPDWTEQQVEDEVARIDDEQPAAPTPGEIRTPPPGTLPGPGVIASLPAGNAAGGGTDGAQAGTNAAPAPVGDVGS